MRKHNFQDLLPLGSLDRAVFCTASLVSIIVLDPHDVEFSFRRKDLVRRGQSAYATNRCESSFFCQNFRRIDHSSDSELRRRRRHLQRPFFGTSEFSRENRQRGLFWLLFQRHRRSHEYIKQAKEWGAGAPKQVCVSTQQKLEADEEDQCDCDDRWYLHEMHGKG